MTAELLGDSTAGIDLAAEIRAEWQDAGADGALLARHLSTGAEIGFDVERVVPLASLVKVPIALVACDLIASGDLRADQPVPLGGATRTPGPTGVSAFRHSATIALGDLLYLMLAVSDNAAADAVIDLIGLEPIRSSLARWRCDGVIMRHRMRALYDSVSMLANDDVGLALELAIRGSSGTGSHPLPVLDVVEANAGTARGLVGLLERVWLERISTPDATTELRRLLGLQLALHRLQSELAVDGIRVSSKTATFLNLRHEIGVVETDTGDLIAIAAMTVSRVRAFRQPEIDYLIGSAARRCVDLLRD
jgi:beta-lactamase class A